MFSIPGTLVLIVFLVLHPQEYFHSLEKYPILNASLAVALFGFLLDLRLGLVKLKSVPQLWWVVAFDLWCLVTIAIRTTSQVKTSAMALLVPTAIFLLIAHAIQSFRGFHLVLGMLLSITVFLSVVGVEQKFAPRGCFPVQDYARPVWDGRYCPAGEPGSQSPFCTDGEGAEPGVDYVCAHIGLLGTYSVGERVRFLGKLEDPNELALVIAVGMPIALGFLARRRSASTTLGALVTVLLGSLAAVYSQSRGGQLTLGVVLGTYFVRRFGLRGLLLGVALALPVLLFGGRDNADDSSMERLDCSYAGLDMFIHSPLFGVGHGLFTDHHLLTAHNSFVLAIAELGLPGYFLWTIILYLSIKTSVVALQRYAGGDVPGSEAASDWGMVLLAGWLGMLAGIFFLSFCYKEVLWIYIGFSGALYSVARRHDPDFEVKLTWRELALVVAGDVILIATWGLYVRWKIGSAG